MPLAWTQSSNAFYLHDGSRLDERMPSKAIPSFLELIEPEQVWKTEAFTSDWTFSAGTWILSLWIAMSEGSTQFNAQLRIYQESGDWTRISHSFTPVVDSNAATEYRVAIEAPEILVAAGESLSIGLVRQWQNESDSFSAILFFDSINTPSSVTSPEGWPETNTTWTQSTSQQHVASTYTAATGWGLAVVALGAGTAAAAGGLAVATTTSRYPNVFAYRGYYYCSKHRVPLWLVRGWLWCPIEGRYLRPYR